MALSANNPFKFSGGQLRKYPVAASTHIYAGARVSVNADGYLIRSTDTSGSIFKGVAVEEVNNTGSAGDVSCLVDIGGAEVYCTHTTGSLADPTNRGDHVYNDGDDAVDVYSGVSNPSYAGQITEVVSATKCWVKVPALGSGPGLEITAQATEALAVTNLTDGSANNTLEDIGDTSMANQSAPIERNFDKICDEVNLLKIQVDEITAKLNARA